MKLTKNENIFIATKNFAQVLKFSNVFKRQILVSPERKNALYKKTKGVREFLTDGHNSYAIKNGCPILHPKAFFKTRFKGRSYIKSLSSLNQYILLSKIKQIGNISAPLDCVAAKKTKWRFKEFCKNLSGLVLDIGADRPSLSAQLFSRKCKYIGLDPFSKNNEFKICGMGEMLPFKNRVFDIVSFNTSLDHILDYHTAILEAWRVLKKNGLITIQTYIWIKKATLLSDSVHFHHFREFEIIGALNGFFKKIKVKRYECPKHDLHRYVILISARKKSNKNEPQSTKKKIESCNLNA